MEQDYWKTIRNALGNQKVIFTGAVAIVLNGENKILLLKNHSSKWSLPGGLQELNESISDTIVREIREEMGVEMEIEGLLGVYTDPRLTFSFVNGDVVQPVIFLFKMKAVSYTVYSLQEEEVAGWAYFGLDALPSDITTFAKEYIEDFLGFNGNVFLK